MPEEAQGQADSEVQAQQPEPQESPQDAPSTPPEPPKAGAQQDKPSAKVAASINGLIRQAAGYEAPPTENGSAPKNGEQGSVSEQRSREALLAKPLSELSPDELREAAKARPELFRVVQSERDRAAANGAKSPPPSEGEVRDASKVLDAAVASAFGVMDKDILNGVLFDTLPKEAKLELSGKAFGRGSAARINAAKAFLEAHTKAAKAAGRAELEDEILRNGGVRDAFTKRANAQRREEESSDDLPGASRDSVAPATPSLSSSQAMNALLRGGRR